MIFPTEANGLVTYDRTALKVVPERVAAVNRGESALLPRLTVVAPTSTDMGLRWRYTLAKPAGEWLQTLVLYPADAGHYQKIT